VLLPDVDSSSDPSLAEYANELNVSLSDAVAFLDAQARAAHLAERVEEIAGDTFGGMYVDNQNESGRIVIALTSYEAQEAISSVLLDHDLRDMVIFERTQHPRQDLLESMRRLEELHTSFAPAPEETSTLAVPKSSMERGGGGCHDKCVARRTGQRH
jgi:hypothetical protein